MSCCFASLLPNPSEVKSDEQECSPYASLYRFGESRTQIARFAELMRHYLITKGVKSTFYDVYEGNSTDWRS